MKATVKMVHRNNMRCETDMPGGAGMLRVDSLKHKALPDCGHSPLELLALAHGTCTGMLVAMRGAGEGVDVRDMAIEVIHDYEDGPPMRLKTASIRFLLAGEVSADQEARMLAAAAMCPVHTALRSDIPVTMEFASRK